MNKVLLIAFLHVIPFAAHAADDLKVTQLEQDVRNLQREVNRLTQELDQLRAQVPPPVDQAPLRLPSTPRQPNSDQWLDASRWQQLKMGMSELQVISLLGPPASMRGTDQDRTLMYAMEIGSSGFLGGSVTLHNRAVVAVKIPVLQ